MANVFLTVLGTGFYSECDYFYGNQTIRTKYVQEALIKILTQGWQRENGDKIVILLTKDARTKNYLTVDENNIKLDRLLLNCGLNIEEVDIEVGANEDELRQIFNQIVLHTNAGDHVIMDITHSLRNIPVQALVALNYAKVLKNVQIDGIYYGAFELGKEQEETKVIKTIRCACGNGEVERTEYIKRVEIFNLNMYIELLDWTHAINTFLQTGSANEVQNLYKRKQALLNKNQDGSINNLQKVVGALYNFTSCISNSRGMLPEKKVKKMSLRSIGIAANMLDNAIEDLGQDFNMKLPLAPLFEKVREEVQPFVGKDNLGIGIATVQWCIHYDMIQQGYTALEETLKTFVCNQVGIADNLREEREEKASKILSCMNINQSEWKVKNDYMTFITEKVKYFEDHYPTLNSIVSKTKECRNDINHFGFQDRDALSIDVLKKQLEEIYQEFVAII